MDESSRLSSRCFCQVRTFNFFGQIYFLFIVYFGFSEREIFNGCNLVVIVTLILVNYNLGKTRNFKFDYKLNLKFLITASILTLVYGIYFYYTQTLDLINHFYLASQVVNNKIPPTTYAFPDIPIKYHYGWNLLLGGYNKLTSLNFGLLSSVLTVLFIISALFLLIGYFSNKNYKKNEVLTTVILFFTGGGFIVLASNLFGSRTISGGLSLLDQIKQSSWTFGTCIFLIFLYYLRKLNYSNKNFKDFLIISPVFLSLGLTSASGYVLALLFFLVLLLQILMSKHVNKIFFINLFYVLLGFAFFYVLSKNIGGMLISGSLYDNPKFIFSPLMVPFKIYAERIVAYLLFFSPVTTIISLMIVYKLIIDFKNIPKLPVLDIFLYACVICLYWFPVFIWVENSAYWDNFCKFNYFGILASWILLIRYLGPLSEKLKKFKLNKKLVYVLLILLLSIEFSYKLFFSIYNNYKVNTSTSLNITSQNTNLLKFINTKIPLDKNIYIVNNELKEMYPVDTISNKSNVNLYGFINKYFYQFTDIPKKTGRSIANFYDFNFFMNRTLEKDLWITLDLLYKGDSNVLDRINGDYIISNYFKIPDYAKDWNQSDKIKVVEKSTEEDWIIYKVK
jgi:hypothetical protein